MVNGAHYTNNEGNEVLFISRFFEASVSSSYHQHGERKSVCYRQAVTCAHTLTLTHAPIQLDAE